MRLDDFAILRQEEFTARVQSGGFGLFDLGWKAAIVDREVRSLGRTLGLRSQCLGDPFARFREFVT